MKTTIELPDALARKAKLLAADRQTTLRALVVQGLEHVLAEKQVTAKDRAKKLFAAMDRAPGITAGKRLSRDEANAR
jgi:predicted transcriptional regulator